MAKKTLQPPQHQDRQPGIESWLRPAPDPHSAWRGQKRLEGKRAYISGGDSGIGRAVAIAFAEEGADVAIAYFDEHADAEETAAKVAESGRTCERFAGDLKDPEFCKRSVRDAAMRLGGLDILINNAAVQYPQQELGAIDSSQLEDTFRTNFFAYVYCTQAALELFETGACIVSTASVTAYRGSPELIDYASTKGAIVAFTRSLALNLADKEIRVNAVAPGPVWTPLIPASFDEETVATFGSDVPMKRPAQPGEIAPSYVFLASEDASYMTGQVLHPNGGEIVNA